MRRTWRVLATLTILALPACTITWREPTLQPLNANRFYASAVNTTCHAAEQVIKDFGLTIKSAQYEERACLIETDFKVLSDTGDEPANHLKKVAWTGVGGFIGGRYTVTATGRSVRDGGTRVRVTTRIEGYINEEFGYQVLRSRGVIEDALFASLGEAVGEPPTETR